MLFVSKTTYLELEIEIEGDALAAKTTSASTILPIVSRSENRLLFISVEYCLRINRSIKLFILRIADVKKRGA